MRRALGKMSVHHLFDWRNRVGDTVQETIEAFLKDGEVGEHVAARWIETPKGVMILQMMKDDPNAVASSFSIVNPRSGICLTSSGSIGHSPRICLTAFSGNTSSLHSLISRTCCPRSSNRPPLSPSHPAQSPKPKSNFYSRRSRHASVRQPYSFDQPQHSKSEWHHLWCFRQDPAPSTRIPENVRGVDSATHDQGRSRSKIHRRITLMPTGIGEWMCHKSTSSSPFPRI